ncbi:MAG: MarR family winged helix-turn-helix transcriptional regulator [Oscillospiraceae bacterium]
MMMDGLARSEYGNAAAVFDAMDRMRRIWASFQPPPPLKRGDMAVLGALTEMDRHKKGPMTAGALAKVTRQSMPAISQKLRLLEENGYLQRVGATSDRRVVHIELTAKGRRLASGTLREFWGRMEQALAVLGDEKTELLVDLLGQLSSAIEQVQNQAGPSGEAPQKETM